MVFPTRASTDVSAADLTTHQSASASAASGSADERPDQVTSLFLQERARKVLQELDQKEFKDVTNWARATEEGKPYKLDVLSGYEAFLIVPATFMQRLTQLDKLGIKLLKFFRNVPF